MVLFVKRIHTNLFYDILRNTLAKIDLLHTFLRPVLELLLARMHLLHIKRQVKLFVLMRQK